MRIEHTSARHLGQVFVPGVNRALLVVTIGLCLLFQHSSALAAAYGVAVSTTMVITTLLVAWVAIEDWGWNPWWTGAISAGMLCVDLTFFAANLVKIPTGGWLPLSMAGALFLAMSTWKRGNAVLEERLKETRRPLETLLEELEKDPPQRMQGTAVVLTESRHGTPAALLHQLELNRMLHEQVIVLTLRAAPVPYLPTQVEIEELPLGFYRVMARHGFMQTTRIRAVLERCREQGIDLEVDQAIFLLSRQAAVARETIGMPQWRGSLYALMQRNALPPSDYLALPHGKVIELGVEVEV
jgi:KUP system potassium uptake protein